MKPLQSPSIIPRTFSRIVATVSATFAAACISTSSAQLFYEGFDYNTGLLTGQNGGSGFTNAWSNLGSGGTEVLSPGLNYTDPQGDMLSTVGNHAFSTSSDSSRGANRSFDSFTVAPNSTGMLWLSFIGNSVAGNFGSGIGNAAVLMLRNSDPSTDMFAIGKYASANGWRFRAGSTLSTATTASSLDQAFVVVRMDINTSPSGNDAVYMWLNPDLNTEPVTGDAAASLTGTNLWDSFSVNQLRLASLVSGGSTFERSLTVDEIRLATTYAQAIPEPSAMALVSTTLGGFLLLRKLLAGRKVAKSRKY